MANNKGAQRSLFALPGLNGIKKGLAASVDVTYKVGIYATRNVCSIVANADLADAIWVSGMSTGYSGNLGFRMPENWWYNQIKELSSPSLDRNVVSSRSEALTSAKPVPVVSGAFDPLHWGFKPTGNQTEVFGLMKLQVMAEDACQHQNVPSSLTSDITCRLIMDWQQQQRYAAGILWENYTPTAVVAYAGQADLAAQVADARDDFNLAAGAASQLDVNYGGYPFDHCAATAHGVWKWGAHEGEPGAHIGDAGGWALDFIQLWRSYAAAGFQGGITNWVNTHLGSTDAGAVDKGFDQGDLRADADGWLIGKALRDDSPTFGDAWRALLVSNPTPQSRIKRFLQERFDTTPNTKLRSALEDCWITEFLSPVGLGRMVFMDPYPNPTSAEREELCDAATARLLSLAGL